MVRDIRTNRAFTLIELLVVISIIALLIALLLPALGKARTSMKNTNCASNLRQLVIAQHAFASDQGGQFPSSRLWVHGSAWGQDATDGLRAGELFPYVNGSEALYLCPVAVEALTSIPDLRRNYSQNWNVGPKTGWAPEEALTVSSITKPSDLITISEENDFTIPGVAHFTINDGFLVATNSSAAVVDGLATFHNPKRLGDLTSGFANGGFADGHVDYRSPRLEDYTPLGGGGRGSGATTRGNNRTGPILMMPSNWWLTDSIPARR